MDTSLFQDARMSAAAERQMRTWSKLEETASDATSHRQPKPGSARALHFIAISREAGAEGSTVAQLVGQRLGWDVYDKNLLDQVAERHKESRLMLDLVDETQSNWVFDVLGTWMDRHIITHERYVVQLSRMIQLLGRSGPGVYVGRGAQFLLPRNKTFAVRLVAPEPYRAEVISRQQNLSPGEALNWIRRADKGRREFIERFFHHDICDPHIHDLVINVGQLGPQGAADLITHAVRSGAEEGPMVGRSKAK